LENKELIVLETENLYFSYEKKRKDVLKNINLKFYRGKVYGIFGPNGSGKSTLIRLISGIIKSEKGIIKLYNKELKYWTKKEIAKKIAYLPQENLGFADISVFYFLLLSRYPYLSFLKEFKRDDFHNVEKIIKEFNLSYIKNRPLYKLSGGEKRKVLLSSLFVVSPEIFILDEPDSFLDPFNKREIENILKLLKTEKKTLIFSSHSLELITSLSDELIGLKDGKIIYSDKNLSEKNSEIFSYTFNVKYKTLKTKKRLFFVYE